MGTLLSIANIRSQDANNLQADTGIHSQLVSVLVLKFCYTLAKSTQSQEINMAVCRRVLHAPLYEYENVLRLIDDKSFGCESMKTFCNL